LEIYAKNYDAAKTDINTARKGAPGNVVVMYMQTFLDFQQGKNAEARDGAQKVLHLAPDYMPALLIAGATEYRLGASTESAQYLTKYLDANPSNLFARKLLVSALLKGGHAAKAVEALDPALKDYPQDVAVLTLAGEANMQAKAFSKATEYFEKASALDPKAAALHTELGLSKLGLGKSADAISELETAVEMDNKSPKAGILLVMTHVRLKEYDKALEAANALEKEQPKNPLIQNLKGGIYLGKNDFENARKSFQDALTIQPTYFPAIVNLAEMDLRENKPDVAKKRFETLLQADKKNIGAMDSLADLAMSQKHVDEATTWLERASAENPDSLPAAMRLANHYLRIGEKQKALNLASKLQAANQTNPDILGVLAQAQFANDQKQAALESYQRLANLLPDSAAVQLQIAAIQMALRNGAGAAEAVKKALAIQPDSLNAEVAQASLYMLEGNKIQAIDIAKQIQKQSGKAAIGFELEGDIELGQKKPELAAKAYEQALTTNGQNPRLIMKLHGSLLQAGRSKEADARITQWMKEHPADVSPHFYLAQAYLGAKQNKAAIEQYQLVLHQQPQNVGALNNLALAYREENDPRAVETAEKAFQLNAESPPVLDTLGWLLVEQGNTTRGLPMLQKASTSAPNNTEIRYHLALGLVKAGDKVKARTELQTLLAIQQPFAQKDEAKALLDKL
jgi:putative PEP-CTERM system TPR-repeat lipoprotein